MHFPETDYSNFIGILDNLWKGEGMDMWTVEGIKGVELGCGLRRNEVFKKPNSYIVAGLF